jgi:hypothetical protein
LIFDSIYPNFGIRLKDSTGVVFDVMLSTKPCGGEVMAAFIVEPFVDERLEDVFFSFYKKTEDIRRDVGEQSDSGLRRQWPKTCDRIFWLHPSGAKTTVKIKKIGLQRQHTGPIGLEGLVIEKLFVENFGFVKEMLVGDAQVQTVEQRYLIEVKLEAGSAGLTEAGRLPPSLPL